MGQAKARGSFELRKAEGAVRLQVEALEREREAAAREAALTPAQRESRRKIFAILAMAQGMVSTSMRR